MRCMYCDEYTPNANQVCNKCHDEAVRISKRSIAVGNLLDDIDASITVFKAEMLQESRESIYDRSYEITAKENISGGLWNIEQELNRLSLEDITVLAKKFDSRDVLNMLYDFYMDGDESYDLNATGVERLVKDYIRFGA